MKQDRRPSYVRLLGSGKLMAGMVGRGAPLPLLAMVVVSLAVMGANVLVFHLLEAVLSQLTDPERLREIAGAILVAGAVILIRELLEMVADPIAAYVVGRAGAVLTEAMNQKVERLEVIDFETLEANERLELAKAGTMGAISMLMTFLFPVFQVTFFATAAIYLHSLSPLLSLVVPLTFLPRIASHLVRGSRYYRLERKTVTDAPGVSVPGELPDGSRVLQGDSDPGSRVSSGAAVPKDAEPLQRGAMARRPPDRRHRSRAERPGVARLRRLLCAGGVPGWRTGASVSAASPWSSTR